MEGQQYEEMAYLFALQFFEEVRAQIIGDVLTEDADLFQALYETKHDNLREILLERYELRALQRQWTVGQEKLGRRSEKEVHFIFPLFIRCYRDYVSGIRGNILDMYVIESKLQAIEILLEQNRAWKKDVRQLEMEFWKSDKVLEDRLKELQEEQ